MPHIRDDFSDLTIRTAASRVGYRCSYPGCNNATVGASYESESKVSKTGVAAHICAAAKNGPRYDATMSTEQRKSVENCIWLCQTHARLIDTDVKKYTVEELRNWKKEAEAKASLTLADSSFFDNYFLTNGNNLYVVENIFDCLIKDGKYDKLSLLLNQYNYNISEIYDEMIVRYKIIYDVYCSRDNLSKDITTYTTLPYKGGTNKIIELFIEFDLVQELKQVIDYCNDSELISIAQLTIQNKLFDRLFVRGQENDHFSCPECYYTTISKTIANYAYKHNLYLLRDESGKRVVLYNDEFYYKIISILFDIGYFNNFGNVINSSAIEELKKSMDSIHMFDPIIKTELIANILHYLVDSPSDYMSVFCLIDSHTKELAEIKKIHYIYSVINEFDSINLEELLSFALETNQFTCLQFYLSKFSRDKELEFINDHQYLFAKDSYFIYRYYLLNKKRSTDNIVHIMNKNVAHYSNDFLYNCIKCVLNEFDNQKQQTLSWLNQHLSLAHPRDIPIYIDILYENKQWESLQNLSERIIHNELLFTIANYLKTSNIPQYVSVSLKIYLKLIETGYKAKGLHYNCGIIQYDKGQIENAKNSFQLEYDLYKEDYSLGALLNLRYSINEFKNDKYFSQAKKSTNAFVLNVLGATLIKMKQLKEARKYLLRSLLIDDNNIPCIKGLFSACSTAPESANESGLNIDTICEISNNEKCINIAIHQDDTLIDINPNNFANCSHYSCEHPDISSILFANIGDSIEFRGNTYVLKKVTPLNTFLSQLALTKIIESPETIKIEGSNAIEAIEAITDFMKSSSLESQRVIDEYNTSNIRYPLSCLAKVTGKSMLNCSEFLVYGNTQKIRNNKNLLPLDPNTCTLVLSYDSVINIFLLNIGDCLLKKVNLICPPSVYQQIMSDISEDLSDLTNNRITGKLIYDDGKIGIIQHDQTSKTQRYHHLAKLKDFVNKIPVGSAIDYIEGSNITESIFTQDNLYCEKSCLALTKHEKNAVLLTDDQFLYSISAFERIPCVGILGFIGLLNNDWQTLIDVISKLSKFNFASYITFDLYKKIIQLIDQDIENKEKGTETLATFLISDKEDTEASDHHRIVVLELYKSALLEDSQLITHRDMLYEIAIYHFCSLYPEQIKRIVQDSMTKLFTDSDD